MILYLVGWRRLRCSRSTLHGSIDSRLRWRITKVDAGAFGAREKAESERR